jgi:hypothetical protein
MNPGVDHLADIKSPTKAKILKPASKLSPASNRYQLDHKALPEANILLV